jgi:ribosome-associated protein
MTDLRVNRAISLHPNEIEERFIHAPGPGGQHVNKAATAVQLRFDIVNSPSLPDRVRQRLLRLAGKRVTKDGVLILEAHNHRSLERNRQEARQRLLRLIRRAAHAPKARQATRPTRSSIEKRLQKKRQRGEKKRLRRPPDY